MRRESGERIGVVSAPQSHRHRSVTSEPPLRQRMRRRTVLSASVLAAALVAGIFPLTFPGVDRSAFAATPSAGSPEATLVQIQRQLNVKRRQLAQTQQRERQVLGQLSSAQERLQRAEVRLRSTTVALTGTQRQVAQATEALADVTGRLTTHEALMGARLRAFYERGPLGYLDVLLGATDFRDFATRTFLIGLIVNRDLGLYHQVAVEREQKDDAHAALAEHEQQLAEQQQRWFASRQETARLAVERRALLEHVRQQRMTQEAALRELEQESARITEIIRRATGARGRGPILTLRNGALTWPVPGLITSGYGWRIHPIFHTREFHTGIDIAAPWGTPIEAAADGTVIYTGWMTGYGMLVILDHGDDLSTTYSHLSSCSIKVGDRVRRGQVVARIGSTGWSTGPHLFFEVRRNGQPLNPLGP